MNIINITLLSSILFFSNTFAAEGPENIEVSWYKDAQNEIEHIIHSNDADNLDKTPRSYTTFPSTHPSTASVKTFAWFNESFQIYLWRDASNVAWVEINPINGGAPFICGQSFDIAFNGIIQIDLDYGIVNLEDSAGTGICDTVYRNSIFKLVTWPDRTQNDDLNNAFDLYFRYDDLNSTYVISLTTIGSSSGNSTSQPNADKLFNWAETTYAAFFPSNQSSGEVSPWYFRYYSSVDTYLGLNYDNNHIYVLGDVFGGLVDVGDLDTLLDATGGSSGDNSSYPSESDLIGSYTRNSTDTVYFKDDHTGEYVRDLNVSYRSPVIDDFTWSYDSGKVTLVGFGTTDTDTVIAFDGASISFDTGEVIAKDGGSTSPGPGGSSCDAGSGKFKIDDSQGPTLYDSKAFWSKDVWRVWSEKYETYPGIVIGAASTVANVSLYIKDYSGPRKYLLTGVASDYPSQEWAFGGANNGVYSTDDVRWPFYIDVSRPNSSYVEITSDNGSVISGKYFFTAYDETRELRRDVEGCFVNVPSRAFQ